MQKIENTQLSFGISVKGKIWNVQVNNTSNIQTYGHCFVKNRTINISVHLAVKCLRENKLEKLEETVRHEFIHAFLLECGLGGDSHSYNGSWAMNEEMVDWFAINIPSINKAVTETMNIFLEEADFIKSFPVGQDGVFEDEIMDTVIEKALTKKLLGILESEAFAATVEHQIEEKLAKMNIKGRFKNEQ